MRDVAGEVRVVMSEEQLWDIAEAAGGKHSAAGWERADAWAELNTRVDLREKWTQVEIAKRAGKSQGYVAKCIGLAKEYSPGNNRPDWTDAYDEAFKDPHLSKATGEVEWYTPAEYINLARHVMGGIDLDPASSVIAQETVRAEQFYTVDDDGLSMAWHGRVWMNPPYKQPAILQFIMKMVSERQSGSVVESITLTNDSTDTAWFQLAAANSEAVAFPSSRVGFMEPKDGMLVKGSPLQGQAFFYMGNNAGKFAQVFSGVGTVFRRF